MNFVDQLDNFYDVPEASGTSVLIAGETDILATPSVRTVNIFRNAGIAGETIITAESLVRDIFISRHASISGETNVLAYGVSRNEGAVVISGETSIKAIGSVSLSLTEPEPIINELSPTAFQHRSQIARLLVNNTEVKFRSFNYARSLQNIGSNLSINLAKADLAQIPNDASFKFQIGTFISGSWNWKTILENGKLDSRNYSLNFNGDLVSFSSVEPLADRFDLCPRRNIICYSSSKLSVELDEVEPLFDVFGNQIVNQLRSFNLLTVYQLFNIAFIEGCGFTSYVTNIPNFEVSRCDFSITSSYLEAIAGIIGVFEPVIYAVGNVLYIIDRTQNLPEDFEPQSLPASKITSYSANKQSSPVIDGFLLQFTDSNSAGNYYQDTLKQFTVESGRFGEPNFTSIQITQTYRHWKNTSNPNVVLKTDLIRQVESTYSPFEIVGRTTEDHIFDGQGKRIETRKTVETLVPSLPSGDLTLQTVREEIQEFFYKNDRFNPRRFVQDKSILRINGMIAIDAENQYLDNDFKQDFLEAHKAGNLSTAMTSEFGAIKTVIESLETLGNGQVQTKTTTIDHLRGAVTNAFSDVRSGDISFNSISKVRKLVVWRDGIDLDENRGARIVPFSVGELPFVFALPLATRKLAEQLNKPQRAAIEVPGYDPSLELGVYFAVKNRNNENLGNFLTEGFSVRGEFQSGITTTIDASEV